MYRRNLSLVCVSVCILAVVCWSSVASATIVNIDFNGLRGTETLGVTFSGIGAAGGGTTFNGVTVDSGPSPEDDLLTVIGTNLLDSNGAATTIGYAMTNVGGDNGGTGNDPTLYTALFADYMLSRATPDQLAAPDDPTFTFSGLDSAALYDVFFYIGSGTNGGIAIGSDLGTYTAIDATHGALGFENVAATGGQIVGTLGSAFTASYGATISSVPEPSTIALLATGLFGLLCYAWRKRK